MDMDMDGQVDVAGYLDQQTLSLTEFSDEILLNILRFVPSCDLQLNVRRVNKKFGALCVDKSLISSITLHKEYQGSDEKVTRLLKEIAHDIQLLKLSGCYWLSSPTIDLVTKCKNIVKLDLSGCRLTSLRLSKMLSASRSLRSLAIDIHQGFDASQLSSECKATLSKVTELRQTLLTPSYGVVPCCTSLERLLLYFEIADRTREGEMVSGQLMVGQSNIPHYQHLKVFYARLSPGQVNQEVGRFYLSVLSIRTPEDLRAFLLSAPASFVDAGCSTKNFLDRMAKSFSLEALQLPRSWLNGCSSLLPRIRFRDPLVYLNFSRCSLSGCQLTSQVLRGGGGGGGGGRGGGGGGGGGGSSVRRDVSSLASLNLHGCGHCLLLLSPDCSPGAGRKAEEEVDLEVAEALVDCCPRLRHLNLSAAHHHSPPGGGGGGGESGGEGGGGRRRASARTIDHDHHDETNANTERGHGHLCLLLARLKRLRSLSLPVCCLADKPPSPHSAPRGLGNKKVRLGAPSHPGEAGEAEARPRPGAFGAMLDGLPFLEELELIGSSFFSNMPRNEPAIRNAQPPCERAHEVREEQVAAIARLQHLRALTLAQLPGLRTGTGLVGIGVKCQRLQALSLANLGLLAKVAFAPALCEMLRHCRQLKDLRLEQPYFSANEQFFQALGHCPVLERLCVVSRHGTFQHEAVVSFMAKCPNLVMCHMFTGETLVSCRSLQQALLQSFQPQRPALNVVIFPLLHEGLADVIRDVPMIHLDEITLFKSRVAEEPLHLWW